MRLISNEAKRRYKLQDMNWNILLNLSQLSQTISVIPEIAYEMNKSTEVKAEPEILKWLLKNLFDGAQSLCVKLGRRKL